MRGWVTLGLDGMCASAKRRKSSTEYEGGEQREGDTHHAYEVRRRERRGAHTRGKVRQDGDFEGLGDVGVGRDVRVREEAEVNVRRGVALHKVTLVVRH